MSFWRTGSVGLSALLLAACAGVPAAPAPSFDRYVEARFEGEDSLAARGEKLFDELDARVASDDFEYFCYVVLASRIRSPQAAQILIEATLSQNESTMMAANLALVALSGRAAGAPKLDDLHARYHFFRSWLAWWDEEGPRFKFPDDLRTASLPLAGTYGELIGKLKVRTAEKKPPRRGPRLRYADGDLTAGPLSADAKNEEDVVMMLRVLAQKTN